jgi:hypothetical protein
MAQKRKTTAGKLRCEGLHGCPTTHVHVDGFETGSQRCIVLYALIYFATRSTEKTTRAPFTIKEVLAPPTAATCELLVQSRPQTFKTPHATTKPAAHAGKAVAVLCQLRKQDHNSLLCMPTTVDRSPPITARHLTRPMAHPGYPALLSQGRVPLPPSRAAAPRAPAGSLPKTHPNTSSAHS